MSSYMDFNGVYDPRLMFAVSNWSDEDFIFSWTSEISNDRGLVDGVPVQYTVHAGEVKTFPQYLAWYFTKNFVDREMGKIAAKATADSKERERLEMAIGNKDMRKPFEEKTIKQVLDGEESPEVTAMREKMRAELIAEGKIGKEISSEMNLNPDGSPVEFPDVPKKKGGRPKKVV